MPLRLTRYLSLARHSIPRLKPQAVVNPPRRRCRFSSGGPLTSGSLVGNPLRAKIIHTRPRVYVWGAPYIRWPEAGALSDLTLVGGLSLQRPYRELP